MRIDLCRTCSRQRPDRTLRLANLCVVITQDAELDGRLDVKHVHVIRAKPLEQVRGVNAMVVADAFAGRYHGGAAQIQLGREMDEPVGQRLAVVAAILLGKEGDLIAVHVGVSFMQFRHYEKTLRDSVRSASLPDVNATTS